ncbi:transposable element Tcb2 transposase [Trichonephila clavipes]|nr:transposable element Tcb2 transposase [Trichonephila clavipes]
MSFTNIRNYPIEYLWDVLEQCVKGHHTVPTNFTELWTALANIRQVILVKRFQKSVESMPRRVAAVTKARGGPTRY